MHLLMDANSNINNDQRIKSEQELMYLTLNSDTSFKAILEIVVHQTNPIVSEYAALFLNTLIKKKQL